MDIETRRFPSVIVLRDSVAKREEKKRKFVALISSSLQAPYKLLTISSSLQVGNESMSLPPLPSPGPGT